MNSPYPFLGLSNLAAPAFAMLLCFGCVGGQKMEKLPILGEPGHVIKPFRFMNQDSLWIDRNSFEDKIYVADFFFTTCPSICPVMKAQMLRVYEKYKNNPQVAFLSHTVDPVEDSIPVLRSFAEKLGVANSSWHFVWGDMDSIRRVAKESYFAVAEVDENAPGGYLHSGHFALVDTQYRIRGIYDGTEPASVDTLIQHVQQLLIESSKT